MVSTTGICTLLTSLLAEHEEAAIPATTYFIKQCEGGKAELVKTKGQLFIQKGDDGEFIKVFFFHDDRSKNGGMPDDSGEILSRYNYAYS
jgi:hypothetical protein|nr:MAG TPA: hypothetical protein [Crassvirales sp.]